jgi:hypothetical protein
MAAPNPEISKTTRKPKKPENPVVRGYFRF